MTRFPYTTRPGDITELLKKLPQTPAPVGKVGAGYVKSLGFSTSSSNYLFNILKALGFVNAQDEPTAVWAAYVGDERRGLVLAAALKNSYPELFKSVFCPYLEGDDTLLDFFQREETRTPARQMALIIETFRKLSELADFQDLMCVDERTGSVPAGKEEIPSSVTVNPNLQLNIQIHIDPSTSDEKIEAIFKNMQKYLLGKATPR